MFTDKKFIADVEKQILFDGFAKPKDISGPVLYLASDMAGFVTGETIKIDGGWTAI